MVKKKVGKKKSVKKISKPKVRSQELVIRVAPMEKLSVEDLLPIAGGDKKESKHMIPQNWVSEKQVIQMVGKTPAKFIFRRKGKGGQVFDYVTGNYITKILNYTFGFNWDFAVIGHGEKGNQVWVLGRLTVKDDHGHTIAKEQFGRADIKMLKTGGIMDFGNDLKSASTDALKKCASLLGIASDIYGKAEYKEETGNDVHDTPINQTPITPKVTSSGPVDNSHVVTPINEKECEGAYGKGCPFGNSVTPAEEAFSTRMFKKALCRQCQVEAKK